MSILDKACFATVEDRIETEEKLWAFASLLLEARDALPAISLVSARLHNVDLTLADRIEAALEPWRIKDA